MEVDGEGTDRSSSEDEVVQRDRLGTCHVVGRSRVGEEESELLKVVE